MNHLYWGYLSGVLEIVGSVLYIHTIMTKSSRPSATGWSIWSLVGIILFSSYLASGAFETLWLPGVAMIFNIIFTLLTFCHGFEKPNVMDRWCIAGALITLPVWAITQSAIMALTMIVIVHFIGSLPTLIKTYKQPFTEDRLTWGCWALAANLNLLAIKSWNYEIIVFPLEFVVVMTLIFVFSLGRTSKT